MLVVEKARHIEVEIRGPGAESVLEVLRREFPKIKVSGDDEYEPIADSAWFAELEAEVSPALHFASTVTMPVSPRLDYRN